MDNCRAWSNMIGDRKRAAPSIRSHRAVQGRQERLCVRVRNRKYGNFRQDFYVFQRQTFRVRCCADPWSQGIAGIQRHIHHASPLNPIRRSVRSLWKNISLRVAISARVRVNEAANRSVFRGDLRFDATPRRAISRDNDAPFH